MSVRKIIDILDAFSRYLDFVNTHGYDEVIEKIIPNFSILIITLRGHQGETYDLEVWISEDGELNIRNSTGESMLAEEYGMTIEDIRKIRKG